MKGRANAALFCPRHAAGTNRRAFALNLSDRTKGDKVRETTMKMLAAALVLSLSVNAALEGGPVIVEDEGQPEVIAASPRSGWVVPVVVGLVVLCAIACGGDDDDVSPGSGSGGND